MTSSPQKIISIFFFISSLIIPHTSIANNDLANAKKEAEAIGSINLNKAQGLATQDPTSNKVNQVSVAEVMNFQGTEVPEKAFADGNIYDASQKKSTDANSNESIVVKDAFLKQKEFRIDGKDTFLDKADHVQKNPETYVDWLKGKYSDCEQKGGDDLIAKEKFTCDEYQQVTDKKCKIGRILEVDAKHSYQCQRKRVSENKICSNNLTVTCEKKYDCDSGGIVLTSIASDMQWQYSYPNLILGSIGDNYWSGWCAKYVRSTKFEVKNKKLIEEFRIIQAGYDDHMRISINGAQIINYPYGGDYLIVKNGAVETRNDGSNYSCELNTSYVTNTNIDLLPYLKEGTNEILMEVVVGGAGEGWIKIKTNQHCCIQKETWNEVCQ